MIVDKTRKVLHKTLRDYKKSMSVSCKPFFIDEGSTEEDGSKTKSLQLVLIKPKKPSDSTQMNVVKNLKGEEVGSFAEMNVKLCKLSGRINQQLTDLSLVDVISGLVPDIVEKMETLKKATVSPDKPKVGDLLFYCATLVLGSTNDLNNNMTV